MRRSDTLWQFLEQSGALERNDPKELRALRKAYQRKYQRGYKKRRRSSNPEFSIYFDQEESKIIAQAARKHNLSQSRFIKQAALSYCLQTYLVPNPVAIGKIEQLLSHCLNELRIISEFKEGVLRDREADYDRFKQILLKLDRKLSQVFRTPPRLDDFIRESIARNPSIKQELINILNDYGYQKSDQKR